MILFLHGPCLAEKIRQNLCYPCIPDPSLIDKGFKCHVSVSIDLAISSYFIKAESIVFCVPKAIAAALTPVSALTISTLMSKYPANFTQAINICDCVYPHLTSPSTFVKTNKRTMVANMHRKSSCQHAKPKGSSCNTYAGVGPVCNVSSGPICTKQLPRYTLAAPPQHRSCP